MASSMATRPSSGPSSATAAGDEVSEKVVPDSCNMDAKEHRNKPACPELERLSVAEVSDESKGCTREQRKIDGVRRRGKAGALGLASAAAKWLQL